jgi:hypothetical protein
MCPPPRRSAAICFNHEAELDRQQLDIEKADLDIADNHDALVQHTLQDACKAVASRMCLQVVGAAATCWVSLQPLPSLVT